MVCEKPKQVKDSGQWLVWLPDSTWILDIKLRKMG
jgi:hypothetical protein